MWVFYLLASLVLWQSIVSLLGGLRFLSYVRREMSAGRSPHAPSYTPFASIIVPCRGTDQGLRDNIAALFGQTYPAYEIIFVSDSANDPALAVAGKVRGEFDSARSLAPVRFVIAGRASDCGQKVHNLRAAVCAVDPVSEILVFVDTDARPRKNWLSSLVAPLVREGIGAATGYRWFLPVKGGLASNLLAVWNASIASALGARGDRNFCWGGSTAIRRETFDRLRMSERWRGALSDDYALTRALREAKLLVHFVPNCLTASHEDCTFRELVEFTTRQLKITRVYAPHLWKIVLFSNLLFALAFFGGITLAAARASAGLSYGVPLGTVTVIYALGMGKAYLRLRAVGSTEGPLRAYRDRLRKGIAAHLFLWPLTSVLHLYNALAALFSRRITWRGITYELKSPTETVIISRVPMEEPVEVRRAHHAS